MTITVFVLSIVEVVVLIVGLIMLLARLCALEKYVVTYNSKLNSSLEHAFSIEESIARSLSSMMSQMNSFDSQCSTLMAKVENMADLTSAAMKGVDKNTIILLKNLLAAIDAQDAMKLSQVIRSAKTIVEGNDVILEEIENAKVTHYTKRRKGAK